VTRYDLPSFDDGDGYGGDDDGDGDDRREKKIQLSIPPATGKKKPSR
jgi:hypothetical protein